MTLPEVNAFYEHMQNVYKATEAANQ